MHWSEKYLMIKREEMDCAKFVQHVIRDHFKRDIVLPQSQGSLFNQSQQIKDNLFGYCMKTESPKDGDLVLMHGKRMMCHIGVYVKIGISHFVLHTEARLPTATLQPINKLFSYGYKVEGYYKWL